MDRSSRAPPLDVCVKTATPATDAHAAVWHCAYSPASKASGGDAPMCSAASTCAADGSAAPSVKTAEARAARDDARVGRAATVSGGRGAAVGGCREEPAVPPHGEEVVRVEAQVVLGDVGVLAEGPVHEIDPAVLAVHLHLRHANG
eukprot:1922686-Prymnesium_polylepis.1